jgi:deoxycytidine triphosphate deaminase
MLPLRALFDNLTKLKGAEKMIIGLNILLNRIKNGELIKNLSQRDLENPEGAGFDLRAGAVYKLTSPGFLGIKDRKTSEVELIGTHNEKKPVTVTLIPGEFYLVKIIEEISLDDDMIGFFHPRSTLFRCGVVLQTGVHAPGYSGAPSFGLYVAGAFPFEMELGSRIAHINILRIEGSSSLYRGQWQGGRVTTDSRETQV